MSQDCANMEEPPNRALKQEVQPNWWVNRPPARGLQAEPGGDTAAQVSRHPSPHLTLPSPVPFPLSFPPSSLPLPVHQNTGSCAFQAISKLFSDSADFFMGWARPLVAIYTTFPLKSSPA